MKKLKYIWQTLSRFKEMGTVTPSSKAMCLKMTSFIQKEHDKVIVELGAGNGVITKYILSRMAPDAVLFVFEINPELCKIIATIDDPRMILINDDARNIAHHIHQSGYGQVDQIISAIPFLMLPEEVTYEILTASYQILKDEGQYIQMHYSKSIAHLYQQVFDAIDIQNVLINIPPGYVFKCTKHKTA